MAEHNLISRKRFKKEEIDKIRVSAFMSLIINVFHSS